MDIGLLPANFLSPLTPLVLIARVLLSAAD